jgi:hypothetical protein
MLLTSLGTRSNKVLSQWWENDDVFFDGTAKRVADTGCTISIRDHDVYVSHNYNKLAYNQQHVEGHTVEQLI